jgi:hypothetical protein
MSPSRFPSMRVCVLSTLMLMLLCSMAVLSSAADSEHTRRSQFFGDWIKKFQTNNNNNKQAPKPAAASASASARYVIVTDIVSVS